MKIMTIAVLIAAILGASAVAVLALDPFGNGTEDTGEQESRIENTEIDTGEDEKVTITDTLTITCVSGTADAYSVKESDGEQIITFSGITEDTEYTVSGYLNGSIIIEAGDHKFELVLSGVEIVSSINVPIYIGSGDEVDIAAQKDTVNYIYDNRSAVDEDGISACVYSLCDLDIKGKGKLVIVSQNNNGIHTKDDLNVKNLTLYVTCVDNALKGNDSVTITSGTIVLNATSGDGIKTSSTDLSSKGLQRGTVSLNSDDGDLSLTIRSYCDGIDAAFDVVIEQTSGSLNVDIVAGVNASSSSDKVTGAQAFGGSGHGGWGMMPGGGSWGQGGPDSEGNSNKADYSCKGIKAADAISIASGTVTIDAYDDALHANSDETMESGVKATGSITVSGGTVTLNSKDDGAHADGILTISGGTVSVTGSYEALEGKTVRITGGKVSLISSDDGVNAIGGGIVLSGGYLYVFAGGDGLDTNSSSISFAGTDVVIVSTSGGNSAIDADYSYTYSGGTILAICPSGMTQEITGSSAFKTYGVQKSMGSLSKGTVVTASVNGSVMAAVKLPASMSNAAAFYIGSSNASISTGSVSNLDENGVYFRS